MILNCLNLYSFKLSRPVPRVDVDFALACGFLHEPSSVLVHTAEEKTIQQRFARGNVCSFLSYQKRIVSYCWIAFREEWIGEIERFIKPKTGEAYIFDGFTLPEYRGKGFFGYILTCILKYLKQLDYSRALICALKSNRASVKAIQNAGFEYFQTVSFLKLLGKNILFMKKKASSQSSIQFRTVSI